MSDDDATTAPVRRGNPPNRGPDEAAMEEFDLEPLIAESPIDRQPGDDDPTRPDEATRLSAIEQVAALFRFCLDRGATLALAESCTGGLFCKLLTDQPGSSAVLLEGLVVYSNAAKTRRLGVAPALLVRFGAVSTETAAAMAVGLLGPSGATATGSISGVAGPGGAVEGKPVGTVAFGVATIRGQRSEIARFDGNRATVRYEACRHLARMLLEQLQQDET
jgi:nicotinamide-nucleotide amidase